MKTNFMNPDQGSYCLHLRLPKYIYVNEHDERVDGKCREWRKSEA